VRWNIHVPPEFRTGPLERAIKVAARLLPHGNTAEDRQDLYKRTTSHA
jgi:hypothetical protein